MNFPTEELSLETVNWQQNNLFLIYERKWSNRDKRCMSYIWVEFVVWFSSLLREFFFGFPGFPAFPNIGFNLAQLHFKTSSWELLLLCNCICFSLKLIHGMLLCSRVSSRNFGRFLNDSLASEQSWIRRFSEPATGRVKGVMERGKDGKGLERKQGGEWRWALPHSNKRRIFY